MALSQLRGNLPIMLAFDLKTFSSSLTKDDREEFVSIIRLFYEQNRRDLPWRETRDPYEILVSEIMLQQTQIPRVLPKYTEWLSSFPTLRSLSLSPQSSVLQHWQGLGYNRRGLNLHRLSKVVVEQFNGTLPLEIDLLESLPGIGHYTARAVYTFSTNKPSIFIETNIRTVFLYHFFSNATEVKDSQLLELIEATLDTDSPREWFYALMDYGSWLKQVYGNPNHKSKHYTKQTSFKGSRRQLRGQILRELSQKQYLKIEEVIAFSKHEIKTTETVLNELVTEGFITIKDNVIRFVEG
jgi:A/G-specific adenine glycosylase